MGPSVRFLFKRLDPIFASKDNHLLPANSNVVNDFYSASILLFKILQGVFLTGRNVVLN